MDTLIILIEAALVSVAIWSSLAIMILIIDIVTGRYHESKILLQEVYYTLSIGFFVGLFYFGLLKLRLEYPGWF